jgi:hypothetical protein
MVLDENSLLGDEVYGFPGCMSNNISPYDIVVGLSEAKMERS